MKQASSRMIQVVFSALQAASVLAGAAGAYVAGCFLVLGGAALWPGVSVEGVPAMVIGLWMAVIVIASVCSVWALCRFFRMCGRLKERRAFTEDNARALGRIGQLNLISAASLMVGAVPQVLDVASRSSFHYGLETVALPLLMAFCYLGVGLCAGVLEKLLWQAKSLVDENDGTV